MELPDVLGTERDDRAKETTTRKPAEIVQKWTDEQKPFADLGVDYDRVIAGALIARVRAVRFARLKPTDLAEPF